jgi:hypothetical protein
MFRVWDTRWSLRERGHVDLLRRSPIPCDIHVSNIISRYCSDTLTRAAKHSNQFAGTTTIITDWNDIVEHTVVGCSEVCEDIDKMICS